MAGSIQFYRTPTKSSSYFSCFEFRKKDMEKERQWNKEYNDFDVNFTSKTLVGLLNELSVANAKYTMTQRNAK